jgi:acyl-CoA synthetase
MSDGAAFDRATIEEYTRSGDWDARTIADLVAGNTRSKPDAAAFLAADSDLTWREYDELSTRVAAAWANAGLVPGDHLGVLMTGGAAVHVAYLAAQKAGLVILGIGPRAGIQEIRHLLAASGTTQLVTRHVHRRTPAADLAAELGLARSLTLDLSAGRAELSLGGHALAVPDLDEATATIAGRALGPDDLFFLNSTSGSTGKPKCVMQTMNIRKYFGPLAREAGGMGDDEVVLSVLPAPFGFGQWSAHVMPAMYGYTTVLPEEFDPGATLRLIAEHRVTMLAAVTSQFVMMLNAPGFADADLSTLKVMFTGGERVPYDRAVQFERVSGCKVLQFYGSNEAGPISVTAVTDTEERRLTTAGRAIAGMRPRLFAEDGTEVARGGTPGRCAVRGPGISPGYFGDPEADAALRRDDGWMLTGDIVSIDEDGYLRVTGRATDFIIRGGQNISTQAIEEAVARCPRVHQVAIVSRPDDVMGERVCAYVVTRDGTELGWEELHAHLGATGVSKNSWPEWLATLPELPLSTGGKVDRAWLRRDALDRFPSSR